jgi:hypothetical protein
MISAGRVARKGKDELCIEDWSPQTWENFCETCKLRFKKWLRIIFDKISDLSACQEGFYFIKII